MTATRRGPGRPRGATEGPAARRERLLDAAEAAIRVHGAAVTMEQIAAVADVSKTTLYDNFADRAALSEALVDRYGRRLLAALGAGLDLRLRPEAVVRRGLEVFVGQIDDDPNLYRFVARDLAGDRLVAEIAVPVGALIAGVLGRQGADPTPAMQLAVAALGAVLTSAEQWSRHRAIPRAAFEELLGDFVWGGLLAAGVASEAEPIDLAVVADAIADALALPPS